MKKITSKSNTKIKEVSKLLNSSKRREQSGLFVVEGLRLCDDAIKSGYTPDSVFVSEECIEKNSKVVELITEKCDNTYEVTNDIIGSISDTVNPQGIVCVFKKKQVASGFNSKGKYIVLVNVADPANLGAVSRTAEALGVDAMLVCGGCDIYNPKALRASMGALLRFSVISVFADTMFKMIHEKGIKTFASTPRENAKPLTDCDFSGGCAVLIGNEANGLDDAVIEKCDTAVTIPMTGRAESLNAAAAASIFCYEMMRGDML